jgi:hypothetical protein
MNYKSLSAAPIDELVKALEAMRSYVEIETNARDVMSSEELKEVEDLLSQARIALAKVRS